MAITSNTYTGNGSNKLFSITFPYLDTSDIDVYLNGTLQTITTQYSFANATTVEFVAAPANGATVKLDRSTDDSDNPATFFPGSSIKAADLNENFDQTLYVVQEINNKAVKVDDPLYANKTYIDAQDATKVSKSGDSMSGNLAMGGNKVTGLGTTSNANDAATKTYVDNNAVIYSGSPAFTQDGAGAVTRSWSSKLKDVISVKDFGAVGDGVADDTVAIQAAIDNAAAMFNQVSFPPAGVYTSPILFFPPGSYRLTNTLNVYTGLTLSGQAGIPYTVEHTRLIMDTQGGTVNMTKNILNLTKIFQGVARSNSVTVTIEDLGFWITNPGTNIPARGGTGHVYNPSGGSHIYCSETCIDTRIRRCNFYSSPNAAIYFNGAPSVAFNVDECEFDTPIIGIRLNNCPYAWPQVNNSRFFSGNYHLLSVDTGGRIQINGSDFQFNARISASGTRQLDVFTFTSNLHEGSGASDNALYVQNAKIANITGNYFGLSTESAVYLVDVDGGTIDGNTIYSPGYNSSNSSAATAPAGIRLIGCKQMAVTGNTITTESATYNGFGIISTTNGARISRCVFTGNKISSVFTGASHRTQARFLNVETTDSLVGNQYDGTIVEYRMLRTSAGVQYAVPLTYQATAGSVLIPLNDTSSSRAYVHIEQASTNTSNEFEIIISRTNFSGVYSIKGVNRDVSANVGLGPHVITTGNTVLFGILGSNLEITFAYTTDPMSYSAVVVGARA